jgi:chromosome partitioning protein
MERTPNSTNLTKTLAVTNCKGGVSKSTVAVHLAAALGELGRRCLLWDLDVNCGATRQFGIPAEMNVYGTYEVLNGEEQPEDVIIRQGDIDGVDLPRNVNLLAAHVKLEKLDQVLASSNPFAVPHEVLLKPLATLNGKYDYVFLDTAPNLTTPTKAAYRAAQYILFASILEPLSIQGLNDAMKYVRHARDAGNDDLRIMGCVISSVPGRITRLARELISSLERALQEGDEFMQPFATYISASTVLPSIQKRGKTLFTEHADHKTTEQYRAIARELEDRFKRLALQPAEPAMEVVGG